MRNVDIHHNVLAMIAREMRNSTRIRVNSNVANTLNFRIRSEVGNIISSNITRIRDLINNRNDDNMHTPDQVHKQINT